MGCMGGMGLGVLSVRLAQCQLPDSENGVSACDVIGTCIVYVYVCIYRYRMYVYRNIYIYI